MKPKMKIENTTHKPSEAEKIQLQAVHSAGSKFRAAHKKLINLFDETLRVQIRSLKIETFKVKAGSAGRFVFIAVGDGTSKPTKWCDFVKANFDCTEHWLNEFIRTKEEIDVLAHQREREAKAKREESDRQLEARRLEGVARLAEQFGSAPLRDQRCAENGIEPPSVGAAAAHAKQ